MRRWFILGWMLGAGWMYLWLMGVNFWALVAGGAIVCFICHRLIDNQAVKRV